MANTTNLDLVKPLGTDHALVSVINSNMDKIDAYAGKTDDAIGGLADGLAIVTNGDTHAAITSGQFVYVRNHNTLSEGLYVATANIAADGELSTSNLTADSSGGLNALNGKIANYLTSTNYSNVTSFSDLDQYTEPGNIMRYFAISNDPNVGDVSGWCNIVISKHANGSVQQVIISSKDVIKRTKETSWGNPVSLINNNISSLQTGKSNIQKGNIASGASATFTITTPALVIVGRAYHSSTTTTVFVDQWGQIATISNNSSFIVSATNGSVTITNNSNSYSNYMIIY